MDEVRANIFPFIALSYDELQPAVKRCFSYCAIFPKDFRINVAELIRIWMGQGFLNSRTGIVGEMELQGREYFEDLATRSLFQDFEFDSVEDERVEWCKMHDLVHDFTQLLTNNECLIAQNEAETQNGLWAKNIRHLNLLKFETKITMDLFSHSQTRKLCSFICTKNEIPLDLFSHLKRVKLLNLNDCDMKDIPREIGNLSHTRYLNLGENPIQKLPQSICDLYNLQTLNLTSCSFLSGLPQGIHKLVNLRHLLVEGTPSQFEFTQGLEKLVNLQTLDRFVCVRGYTNKLGYLKDLNLLGGSLTITIIFLNDAYDSVLEAEKADLKNKSFIQHLTLEFEEVVGFGLMEALQPSPNLLRLDFTGSYLPNWIATLINLRKLYIGEVGNENGVLHSLRNLPFLEELTLYDLEVGSLSLEFLGLSTAATRKPPPAFPKLVSFNLHYCKMLEAWEDIEEEDDKDDHTIISILPCLQRLEIFICWGLKVLPHRLLRKAAASLQTLHIGNCPYLLERYSEARGEDWDKIAHIPDVRIN